MRLTAKAVRFFSLLIEADGSEWLYTGHFRSSALHASSLEPQLFFGWTLLWNAVLIQKAMARFHNLQTSQSTQYLDHNILQLAPNECSEITSHHSIVPKPEEGKDLSMTREVLMTPETKMSTTKGYEAAYTLEQESGMVR